MYDYYVYELADPETGKTFYVGQGQDFRLNQHGKGEKNNQDNSKKIQKIRDIEARGDEVIRRVIGRWKTKKEALAVEAVLIHWVYGHDELTNQQSGHGVDHVREKDEEKDKIPGLDIFEDIEGAYSKLHEHRRERFNIVNKLQEVKELIEKEENIDLSDLDLSNSRFTKMYYCLKSCNLTIGKTHSGTENYFVVVEALSGKKEDREYIEKISESSALESKNHGEYAKLMSQKKIIDIDDILKTIRVIKEEIEKAESA